MIPGKPHPTPNEKIWVAAYTDDRTEYVELRTACPNGKAAYQRLWHKEQPLGMAIADFLYVDLQPLDAHIRQIGQLIAQIDRGDCVQDCFERVFEIALFWLPEGLIQVAPSMGAWIEINSCSGVFCFILRRSLYGSVV